MFSCFWRQLGCWLVCWIAGSRCHCGSSCQSAGFSQPVYASGAIAAAGGSPAGPTRAQQSAAVPQLVPPPGPVPGGGISAAEIRRGQRYARPAGQTGASPVPATTPPLPVGSRRRMPFKLVRPTGLPRVRGQSRPPLRRALGDDPTLAGRCAHWWGRPDASPTRTPGRAGGRPEPAPDPGAGTRTWLRTGSPQSKWCACATLLRAHLHYAGPGPALVPLISRSKPSDMLPACSRPSISISALLARAPFRLTPLPHPSSLLSALTRMSRS